MWFTSQDYYCKSALYIYRANHGQFNTLWGRRDFSPPAGWMLNLKPLISMEEQLKISKLYISAFLQVTIQEKKEYLPMFRNHRTILNWLPKTIYVNRFEDSTFRKIADFEEDINLVTGAEPGVHLAGENLAVWREYLLEFRDGYSQENHVVRLGWKGSEGDKTGEVSRYVIDLPGEFANPRGLNSEMLLVFSITDAGKEPPEADKKNVNNKDKELLDPLDLTLELVDSHGKISRLPLIYFSTLHPPLKAVISKWPLMEAVVYKKKWEPLLETFEFPLQAFKEANPDFDPGKLKKIIFVFDRSSEGVIYLDEIGFRSVI